MRLAASDRRNAFRVKHPGKGGNYKQVSAAICGHFRPDTRRTVLFDRPEIDNDGVMLLDLNSTIGVGKS